MQAPAALSWLLEKTEPGVHYLALRDLCELDGAARQVKSARKAAHRSGPIAMVIDHMEADGYWVKSGPGYNPKYRSTVWSIILLAELGASAQEDKRIAKACNYVLEHSLTESGQFTATGAPSGTADCLQGNLAWALLELGCEPERLERAFGWMAASVTGEGLAPATDRTAPVRYYAGKCGPLFECGSNNRMPCAWGGAKVMLALGRWPGGRRTALMNRAIKQGAGFFLSAEPATAPWPSGWSSKPSGNWWKFGFPVFYVTDLLQVLEVLAALGYGKDRRLQPLAELVRSKQDAEGRWALEYDYTGKTWCNFGRKGAPNKWVTLRALRALR